MSTFQYRAYTKQGVVTSGTIVAEELDAAIEALYGSGLTPVETVPCADSDPPSAARPIERSALGLRWQGSERVGLKELSAFTTELASLVSSGVPVDASFRVLAGAGASPRRIALANGLLKDILAGLQLSEAMGRRPEVFPPDYIAILAGGEAGGQTAQALTLIGEMLARRVEIRNKIRGSLVYPAILLMMSLMSIAVIVFVLIPNLTPIFSDAGLPLPGILAVLADLPDNWPKLLLWGVLGTIARLDRLPQDSQRRNDDEEARSSQMSPSHSLGLSFSDERRASLPARPAALSRPGCRSWPRCKRHARW